ncbi:MAG: hypothetical protein VB070_14955 [Clostridiaceae bacterium]|nr:hypothetical protein [Clostridiaceae bacterium]
MNELSDSKKDNVEKTNTTSHEERINVAKNHISKHPLAVKIVTHLLLFVFCFVIVNYVFRISVTEITLSNTISLGAIFATFGAALISIFTVVEKDKFDRVVTNIEILYIDIMKEKKWRRWQFLKRKGFTKI